jgi:hypothetical protein
MHPHEYAKLLHGEQPHSPTTTLSVKTPAPAREPVSARGPPLDDEALLTAVQTRARLGGVSNMCLFRWQKDPRVQFPGPDLVINNRRYWKLGTLRRWQEEHEARSVRAIALAKKTPAAHGCEEPRDLLSPPSGSPDAPPNSAAQEPSPHIGVRDESQ